MARVEELEQLRAEAKGKAQGILDGLTEAAAFCDSLAEQLETCTGVTPDKVAGARKCARLLYARVLLAYSLAGKVPESGVVERYRVLAGTDGTILRDAETYRACGGDGP